MVGTDHTTLGSSDADRELRRPVESNQRHSEPHPGAPELAIMQFAGLLDAGPALGGLTVATNTAKHNAVMANVRRLKTSFISLPIHIHLAPIFSVCNLHAIHVGNVTHFSTRVPRARRLAEWEDGASESRLRQRWHCR